MSTEREHFLTDLDTLYSRYAAVTELNDALAVLALLAAATVIETEEMMAEAVTPLAMTFVAARNAARAAQN